MTASSTVKFVSVPYVIKGQVVEGSSTAELPTGAAVWRPIELNLDDLVWPGHEPTPLFGCKVDEIIDVLAELGQYLKRDGGNHLSTALEGLVTVCGASRDLSERTYDDLWRSFDPDRLRFQIQQEFGGADVLDGWRAAVLPDSTTGYVRAMPSRILHVMPGNAPGGAVHSLVRGAMTRSVNLLKLPSNDLFSAPALLQSLAEVAPGHPINESFSAVYWRGGDTAVESVLMRSQFFDKIVVWGGASAVTGVARYISPGLELVAFDPKTSISFIGKDAFRSDEELHAVAAAAATDATLYNQEACTSSRYQFVEGEQADIDRYCEYLQVELGKERQMAAACSDPAPGEVRDEIEALRQMPPFYRVWGRSDGTGTVVRSEEPVDFYPSGRTVNVVQVSSLDDAFQHVTAATQTVGIYPAELKATYRDRLCSAGVQRVVTLGAAAVSWAGLPHDGFYPMQRFVRWSKDEA